jgi:hypothetical protein
MLGVMKALGAATWTGRSNREVKIYLKFRGRARPVKHFRTREAQVIDQRTARYTTPNRPPRDAARHVTFDATALRCRALELK